MTHVGYLTVCMSFLLILGGRRANCLPVAADRQRVPELREIDADRYRVPERALSDNVHHISQVRFLFS